MKKLSIITYLFFGLFIVNFSNADYIICDSWMINYGGNNLNEICNWWFISNDIVLIESFTWNFLDINSGYWWISDEEDLFYKVNTILPIWYFNENINTVISNVNPDYINQVWYIWTINSLQKNFQLEKNLPIWFFDLFKSTIIKNSNPEYTNPAWYLWNIIVKSYSWDVIMISTTKSINQSMISTKEFYLYLFKKYSYNDYVKYWYFSHEYDDFNNNLVNLLLNNLNTGTNLPIINEIEQKRIELEIENSDFPEKISLLTLNLKKVNYVFKNIKSDNIKFYMLDYILNKKN